MKYTIPFLAFVLLLTACASQRKTSVSQSQLDAASAMSCSAVSFSGSAMDALIESYTDDSLWCQWSITTITDSAGKVLGTKKNINGQSSWARSSCEKSKKKVLARDSTTILRNDSTNIHHKESTAKIHKNRSSPLPALVLLASLGIILLKLKSNEGSR